MNAAKINLNEYIANNRTELGGEWRAAMTKKIECADGFNMSVQASVFHYSIPRENTGPYESVEVGFPSAKPQFFAEYAEGSGYNDEEEGSVEYFDYTGTVYGHVPIELVEQEIAFHGGLKQLLLENK